MNPSLPLPIEENASNIVNTGGLYSSPFRTVGLRGVLRHREPMAKHTSWRVGGPAEWFYEPKDLEDLTQFIQQIPLTTPIFWIGLGSNLLVRDGGLRGVIILTAGLLNEIEILDDCCLQVQAGVSCAKVARIVTHQGWSGAEFLAGIPGTIGGALAMNAGAFGGDTWSIVRRVETIDRQGHVRRRPVTDYRIGYRSVQGPANEWFVAATLQLNSKPCKESEVSIKALLKKRSETQPIGLPSCGSVFRNPPGDYAARMIESLGWKGKAVGGAYVSEKHANFIISTPTATAHDIETLIELIRAQVKEVMGVELQPEVHRVGESMPPK